MPGLLDIFNSLNPDQNRGLLAAASQILQAAAPGRRPFGIGEALGVGIDAYQHSTDQSKRRRMEEEQFAQSAQLRDLQLRGAQMDLAAQERARDLDLREAESARSAFRTPGQQAASLPGGPTLENAARIDEFRPQFDPEAHIAAVMQFNPRRALELRREYAKAAPKFDAGITFVDGPDGKPVAVRTADDGSHKILAGLRPRDKLHFLNTGGKTLGVNEYTGEQGAAFTNTASAGELLAAATQRRGQDLTNDRARDALELQRTAGKAPTEFQGKSAAFGLRATEADRILSGLTGNYSPAAINSKNAVESTWLVGGPLGAAVNKFALSENDQRAEQAQRDFINAVLRQESGAAIGADEFSNARRQYFPQPGDSAGVIAQKARNRQLAIQGLQSNAGRAAMTATPAGGGITFLGFE